MYLCVCVSARALVRIVRSCFFFIDPKLWVSNWFNRKSKAIHKPHISSVPSLFPLSPRSLKPWVRHIRYGDNHKSHRHTLTWLALPCLTLLSRSRSIGGELSFVRLHVYCLRDFGILSLEPIYCYWRPVAHFTPLLFVCAWARCSPSNIHSWLSLVQHWAYSFYPFTSLFFILYLYYTVHTYAVVCCRWFCVFFSRAAAALAIGFCHNLRLVHCFQLPSTLSEI